MIYINNKEHNNLHELSKENLEGSLDTIYTDSTHADFTTKPPEEIAKLEYIYQHFQDGEKIYETDPQITTEQTDDTLYPQINNEIEYGLFENVIDSYYLGSQIRAILHALRLVTHTIPQLVHQIQAHNVHTHVIIFYNNLTH